MAIFKSLPYSEETRVGLTGEIGVGGSRTLSFSPGDYYVDIAYGSLGRWPFPPGTNLARSGGVPSEGTVTITDSDRIVIT